MSASNRMSSRRSRVRSRFNLGRSSDVVVHHQRSAPSRTFGSRFAAAASCSLGPWVETTTILSRATLLCLLLYFRRFHAEAGGGLEECGSHRPAPRRHL